MVREYLNQEHFISFGFCRITEVISVTLDVAKLTQ